MQKKRNSPRSVSGYFSTVLRQVSNRRPDTLTISFSSWVVRSLRCTVGARGRAELAIGTQPIAAALANGSQAATFAMFGSILSELSAFRAYTENEWLVVGRVNRVRRSVDQLELLVNCLRMLSNDRCGCSD